MPIPVPSSILLIFASVALLAERWSRVKQNRYVFVLVLLVLALTAVCLGMTPPSLMAPADALRQRSVWTNDPLAVCEQWLLLAFGLLTALSMFDARDGKFHSTAPCGYMLFALAGLMLVAQANDLISLGLAFEIIRLSAGGLESGHPQSLNLSASSSIGGDSRSALFCMDWLATGLIWFGIGLLTNATASTQFNAIEAVLTATFGSSSDSIATAMPSRQLRLSVSMIMLGLLAHCGYVPFQSMLLRLRGRFDWRLSFVILAGPLAGSIALTRLLGTVFVGIGPSIAIFILAVSLATMALSAVLALRSLSPGVKSIATILTSLLLLQTSWQAVGLMTVSIELAHQPFRWGAFGQQAETLALIVFGQLSFILVGFCLINGLSHLSRVDRDIEFLEDLKGLSRYSPWASAVLVIGLISAIGGPLTIGFWSRWWIMVAGCNVHIRSSTSEFAAHGGVRFLILFGLATTAVVGVAVIRMAREMYLEAPLAQPIAVGGRSVLMTSVIASTACLMLGLFPQSVMKPLSIVRTPRLQTVPTNRRGSGKNAVGSVPSNSTIATDITH